MKLLTIRRGYTITARDARRAVAVRPVSITASTHELYITNIARIPPAAAKVQSAAISGDMMPFAAPMPAASTAQSRYGISSMISPDRYAEANHFSRRTGREWYQTVYDGENCYLTFLNGKLIDKRISRGCHVDKFKIKIGEKELYI